jgi:hypothetical protein
MAMSRASASGYAPSCLEPGATLKSAQASADVSLKRYLGEVAERGEGGPVRIELEPGGTGFSNSCRDFREPLLVLGARWLSEGLVAFTSAGPGTFQLEIELDERVSAFTTALAVRTTLLLGTVPATWSGSSQCRGRGRP